MYRLEQLTKHVDKEKLGVEVAPYFNPAVPKRQGYNVLILDVFDSEALRSGAADDPHIPPHRIAEIEDVDIVGDASGIGDAIEKAGRSGQIHYIVSSHNFEHLPNPIKFFQGCASALAPGGFLSMAIPDCRACFDHFRMPTRLADWIAAYHRDDAQPTAQTLFDHDSQTSVYRTEAGDMVGCDMATDDPRKFFAARDLKAAYGKYVDRLAAPGPYLDTHCNVTFDKTFELMVRDLHYLGLIELEIVEIHPTFGLEYYVHLRKPGTPVTISDEAFYERRQELLHAINAELGDALFLRHDKAPPPERKNRGLRSLFGRAAE